MIILRVHLILVKSGCQAILALDVHRSTNNSINKFQKSIQVYKIGIVQTHKNTSWFGTIIAIHVVNNYI